LRADLRETVADERRCLRIEEHHRVLELRQPVKRQARKLRWHRAGSVEVVCL